MGISPVRGPWPVRGGRRCARCGAPALPGAFRGRYCPGCARARCRERSREAMAKKRLERGKGAEG